MIRGENLKKTFDTHLVFEHASFVIPDRKIVGFYGESGIGKSTLAKLLCGVAKPDFGHIYLDEKLLCSHHTHYDRSIGIQIQMVYQQPYASLDHSQRILDGFYELIRYHKFEKNKHDSLKRVELLMQEVGLDMDILNHFPHQISGGEAQRISIAKSLLFRPKLLIMDEATSMLDVSTQANVLSLVKRAVLPYGGSILLISHDCELVNSICDKIYIFKDQTLKERK